MINRIKAAKIALRENSGSGVVSVLIAMMFLTILGAIMLYMTYTGLLMKVTEREGTDNFYEAEAAMNVIRAEAQVIVSDTISVAYHEVMSQYSGDAADTFQASFVENIFEYEYEYEDSTSSQTVAISLFPEITSSLPTGTSDTDTNYANYYDISVFEKVIKQAAINEKDKDGTTESTLENITVSVAEDSQYVATDNTTYSDRGTVTVAEDKSYVSFNGISVTYTNPDTGYSTTVQTDIVCNTPDFYASSLSYSITTVPNFALIAQDEIKTATSTVKLEIDGNAYGGSLSLGESATNGSSTDSLTITGGTLIIAGDTTLSNRSTLTIGADADLWTENILLQGGVSAADTDGDKLSSLVVLEGTVYVADDMELNGDYTKVEVPEDSSGEYYGFGSDSSKAGESSAILINGKYTQLNLDGISELMLAGYSFIDTSTATPENAGVLMGESVSVKSNQLLYLAPVEILKTTTGGEVTGNPVLAPGFEVSDTPKSYTVNGVTIPNTTKILTLTYQVGNSTAAYYYLKFETAADANTYFQEYFTANPEAINDYISLYTDGIQLPDDGVMSGSALEVTKDGYDLITNLVEPAENSLLDQMERDAKAMLDTFTNLSRTLSTTQTSTDVDMNPYTYVVDTSKVGAFYDEYGYGTYEFEDESGDVVAKLVYDDYTVGGTSEPAIILVIGDATVNSENYEGLIIASGDITLGDTCKSITADEDAVNDAFQGIYTSSDGTETPFYTFLNEAVVGNTDSSTKSEEYTWNLDELVVYDDWRRS